LRKLFLYTIHYIVERTKFYDKRSTLLPFVATKSNIASTKSNVASTVLPVASTLLLVWTGLNERPIQPVLPLDAIIARYVVVVSVRMDGATMEAKGDYPHLPKVERTREVNACNKKNIFYTFIQ